LLIKPLEGKYVRPAIFTAINRLANHGEWQLERITVQSDPDYKVEFQPVIAELLGELSSHGEWKFENIVGATDPDYSQGMTVACQRYPPCPL
jgi:hypothetical protein